MSGEAEQTLPQRLAALWDHLGLAVAHVAAQMPGDLAGFVTTAPQLVAGVLLCVPSRLDPAPFAGVAERLLMISGDGDLAHPMHCAVGVKPGIAPA